MKKFYVSILFMALFITFSACSSQPKQPKQPRQPRQYGAVDVSNTSTSTEQAANAGVARLSSEPMKIWSRPLEFGFEVNDKVGRNGHIDEIYPKDAEDAVRMNVRRDYVNANVIAGKNIVGKNEYESTGGQLSFDKLPLLAQNAILTIIKDYNLDGFYVTMIEEFEGAIETTSTTGNTRDITKTVQTKKGEKTVKTGTAQEIVTRTLKMKQVRIRGIALKLKTYDPVNEDRSDAVRKASAGAPVIYSH